MVRAHYSIHQHLCTCGHHVEKQERDQYRGYIGEDQRKTDRAHWSILVHTVNPGNDP